MPGAQAPVLAVTGATGFIGGAVTRRFATSGWRVKALVRVPSRAAGLTALGVETVPGDLSQPDALAALVGGAAAVVHCAGAVRGISGADFRAANVDGVGHLARAVSRVAPAVPVVLLSSLAAREPHLSPYAASKRAGEEAFAEAGGGLQWVALRPPAVYGPGDREMRPLLQALMRGLAPAPGGAGGRFSLLYV
nr:NAD(P)-dependent oxidoreductase [Gammaproteobacteria bacterium]